jgi:hypothetical protein
MSRKTERIYPYGIAVAAALFFWWSGIPFPSGTDLLSSSITMAAIFTGFLATFESLIVGFQGPKILALRETKFFDLLLSYLNEAILVSLIYCMWGLLGYFCNMSAPPLWFAFGWVALTFASILTFYRVSSVCHSLIRVDHVSK